MLGTDGKGIRHQIIDQSQIPLGVAVSSCKSSIIDDGFGGACQTKLVQDILCNFIIEQTCIVVVNGDPLTERLMNRLAQGIVQMRLAAENQGKVIYGIIAVVHEHLDVVQDAGIQVLGFINGKEQRLPLLFVKISDLFPDSGKHRRFSTLFTGAQHGTKLLIEVSNADGRQTHVLHVVKTGIQAGCKAPQGIGFPHAGAGGEHADTPYVFEIVQPVCHFGEISGNEVILFLELLFIEWVVGQPIVSIHHQRTPSSFEYSMTAAVLLRFVRQFSLRSVRRRRNFSPSIRMYALSMSSGRKRISTLAEMNCIGTS